jgi:TPR repeat protein
MHDNLAITSHLTSLSLLIRSVKSRRLRASLFALFAGSLLIGHATAQQAPSEAKPVALSPSEEQIRPGLYAISASSNAFISPALGSPKGIWANRAEELCGNGHYQTIELEQSTSTSSNTTMVMALGGVLPITRYKTTMQAFALCDSAGISKDEALKIVQTNPKYNIKALDAVWQAEINALGGSDCTASGKDGATDNLARRGRMLMNQSRYQEALLCLQRAASHDDQSTAYRDACEALAMLYEMGWGVAADPAVARQWYAKAGMQ